MKVRIDGRSFGDVPVLGPVALDVAEGEVLAVTGPSGVGKSTLLRIVAGLDAEAEATVEGAGRVAVVFQEPTLMPWRTAISNVAIPTRCGGKDAQHWLSRVGLGDRAMHFPRQLSLGQQRRVALARAFAHAPDTLLLDEPFASLDEAAAAGVRDVLRELLRGTPTRTILVTHDARDVTALAHRSVRLEGSPATLTAEGISPRG